MAYFFLSVDSHRKIYRLLWDNKNSYYWLHRLRQLHFLSLAQCLFVDDFVAADVFRSVCFIVCVRPGIQIFLIASAQKRNSVIAILATAFGAGTNLSLSLFSSNASEQFLRKFSTKRNTKRSFTYHFISRSKNDTKKRALMKKQLKLLQSSSSSSAVKNRSSLSIKKKNVTSTNSSHHHKEQHTIIYNTRAHTDVGDMLKKEVSTLSTKHNTHKHTLTH